MSVLVGYRCNHHGPRATEHMRQAPKRLQARGLMAVEWWQIQGSAIYVISLNFALLELSGIFLLIFSSQRWLYLWVPNLRILRAGKPT